MSSPHVHRDRLGRSDRADLTALQGSQELHLEARRHLADLVEQQRAAVGFLEQAVLGPARPGEGAAHVTKELRLQQGLGQRTAVDGHEGSPRPIAGVVDGLGDELLARPRFTPDEHGGARGRDPPHQLHHLGHLGGAREQPGQAVPVTHLGPEIRVLPPQGLLAEGPLDAVNQLVGLPAFLEVVDGPELDRFLGRLPAGVRGEEDDVGVRAVGPGGPEDVQPVAVRHAEIRHDDLEGLIGEGLDRDPDPLGLRHSVAALPEQQRQGGPGRGFVIDDQDRRQLTPPR